MTDLCCCDVPGCECRVGEDRQSNAFVLIFTTSSFQENSGEHLQPSWAASCLVKGKGKQCLVASDLVR